VGRYNPHVMVYKWKHRNSRTVNLATRPDIFEMFMDTGGTEKIYVRYNKALIFMMVTQGDSSAIVTGDRVYEGSVPIMIIRHIVNFCTKSDDA